MRSMRWLMLCLFLFAAQTSQAGLAHDSAITWVTAESSHFRIHFHDDEHTLAQHALDVAEDAYQKLTPIFDWQPKEKTEIVLSDEVDYSNGYATPLPSNRIHIFATPPQTVNSLEDHDGWFETVIFHEMVHILHLDKATHEPKNGRNTFGRFMFFFPNLFMPPWMHEGLATYYETDKNLGIGRGQSSYFEMMMRVEVEGGVKPIRQINQPIVTWPLLTSRYLYGVYFYQFIAENYGEETLQKLVESYSNHLIPFRINDLSRDVLGIDMSALWDEFDTYLHAKFDAQIVLLKAAEKASKSITQSGDFKRSLVSDGLSVYVVEDHLATGAKILRLENTGQVQEIAEVQGNARLSAHPTAGLLVSQPEFCHNANMYYDLYRFDATSGAQTRITTCQRYIAATFAADGKSIYAVKNQRGQHAIHQLSLTGELLAVLWQGKAFDVVSSLDASTDGLALAAAVWRDGHGWNIEEFDLNSHKWTKRTDDAAIKTDVKYVGASRDVVFSMDKGSVFNIYRLTAGAEKPVQISSVVGGAFSPLLQGSSLWFVGYDAQGFDVYQSQVADVLSPVVEENPVWMQRLAISSTSMTEPEPYSPWDTLLPTSWFPSFYFMGSGGEFGANIYGNDVLNRHQYQLYAGVNTITSSPVFALRYVYDRFEPLVHLYAQQLQSPKFVNNTFAASTQVQRLDADVVYPIFQMDDVTTFHVGLSHAREELAWLSQSYVTSFQNYQDTLTGFAFTYDTTDQHARSISPSEGQQWMVLAETGSGLGGTYEGNAVALSVKSYWGLGSEQVLAGQAYVGLGSADSRPFQLGGQTWNNIISPVLIGAPYNRRSFALRGYADGLLALQGRDMALASLEYRFPIARIERGWMTPPIGIDKVFGQVFAEAGKVKSTNYASPIYSSVGAELGADLVLFYNLGARLQLGYAQGLDKNLGEKQLYLRFGSMF